MRTLTEESLEAIKNKERISFTNLTDLDAERLAKALKENKTTKEIEFEFYYKDVGPLFIKHIADALESNSTIENIKLDRRNKYSDQTIEIEPLALALKKHKRLKGFELLFMHLKLADVKSIAAALQENKTLRKLQLCFNGIDQQGATLVMKALIDHKGLNDVRLIKCNVSDNHMSLISALLAGNAQMTALDLSYNTIGLNGIASLSNSLKDNKSLKTLNLTSNRINFEGVSHLINGLKMNKSITGLELESNKLDDSCIELIANFLKENETIQELNIDRNKISDEGKVLLVEVVKNNYTLLKFDGLYTNRENLDKLYNYLSRNRQIASCLQPLYQAIKGEQLLNDTKAIEKSINALEKIVADLNDLPHDNKIAEAHRLLTALKNRSIIDNTLHSQLHALHGLLIPFKNAEFQKFADLTVGLMLSNELSMLFKDNELEKEGQLLSLYCLRNHRDFPEIKVFVTMLLFKLLYKRELSYQDKQDFELDIQLLSQKEFLALVAEALVNCNNEHETYQLRGLLDATPNVFTITNACQSPVFMNTFHHHYPRAKSFTTIEDCLFCIKKGDSFLVNLDLMGKTVADLIVEAKEAIEKTFFEEAIEMSTSLPIVNVVDSNEPDLKNAIEEDLKQIVPQAPIGQTFVEEPIENQGESKLSMSLPTVNVVESNELELKSAIDEELKQTLPQAPIESKKLIGEINPDLSITSRKKENTLPLLPANEDQKTSSSLLVQKANTNAVKLVRLYENMSKQLTKALKKQLLFQFLEGNQLSMKEFNTLYNYVKANKGLNSHSNPTLDGFFGINNTSSLQKTLAQVRNKALETLFNEVNAKETKEEKLKLLRSAKTLPLFCEHRSNFVITGAWGKTACVKKIEEQEESIRIKFIAKHE